MMINPIMANMTLNHKFLPLIKLPSSSRFVIKAITPIIVNTNIPMQNDISLFSSQENKKSAGYNPAVLDSELNSIEIIL